MDMEKKKGADYGHTNYRALATIVWLWVSTCPPQVLLQNKATLSFEVVLQLQNHGSYAQASLCHGSCCLNGVFK